MAQTSANRRQASIMNTTNLHLTGCTRVVLSLSIASHTQRLLLGTLTLRESGCVVRVSDASMGMTFALLLGSLRSLVNSSLCTCIVGITDATKGTRIGYQHGLYCANFKFPNKEHALCGT